MQNAVKLVSSARVVFVVRGGGGGRGGGLSDLSTKTKHQDIQKNPQMATT